MQWRVLHYRLPLQGIVRFWHGFAGVSHSNSSESVSAFKGYLRAFTPSDQPAKDALRTHAIRMLGFASGSDSTARQMLLAMIVLCGGYRNLLLQLPSKQKIANSKHWQSIERAHYVTSRKESGNEAGKRGEKDKVRRVKPEKN